MFIQTGKKQEMPILQWDTRIWLGVVSTSCLVVVGPIMLIDSYKHSIYNFMCKEMKVGIGTICIYLLLIVLAIVLFLLW
jgi:hypothetical protein